MKYRIAYAALLALGIACALPGADEEAESPYRGQDDSLCAVPFDTVAKWNEYATSSAHPLPDPLLDQPMLELVGSLGGDSESLEEPLFYLPGYMAHSGDTLFIADISTQELIAVDTVGEVLWKTGGPGEGPGHFSGIGRLETHCGNIFVCNNTCSRVDMISRDGIYSHSINIMRPQDVISSNDSLIVILSRAEQGGDCHLYSTRSERLIHSFGNGNWSELMQHSAGVGGLYGEMLNESLLVYGAQDQAECYICNIYTGEEIVALNRALPAEPNQPEVVEQDGHRVTVWTPITGDLFVSDDGNINILFPTYMHDGSFMYPLDEDRDFSPVTIVDKYSPEGEYLCSWSLPDSLLGKWRYWMMEPCLYVK